MKSPSCYLVVVLILWVGCTQLNAPQATAVVWVCSSKAHSLHSTAEIRVVTLEPEEAVQRLVSGEHPDAIVHQNEPEIERVSYFFDRRTIPKGEQNASVWEMRVHRRAVGTEAESDVKTWAGEMGNVTGWNKPSPTAAMLETERLLQKMDTFQIEHAVYHQQDLEAVIADLNQKAETAGLGSPPLFRYTPLSAQQRSPITLDVKKVSLLDLLEIVTELSGHSYIVNPSSVSIRVSYPDTPATCLYRINIEKWQKWMELSWVEHRSTHRDDPFLFDENPNGPFMGVQSDAFWLLRRYGVYGVERVAYEELLGGLFIVLPWDQIPQLEVILFKIHDLDP